MLADFVCKDFSQSFKISAETHAVLLYAFVTHLRNEFVENGILLTKVDDFHIMWFWFITHKYILIWQEVKIFPFQHLTSSSSAKL